MTRKFQPGNLVRFLFYNYSNIGIFIDSKCEEYTPHIVQYASVFIVITSVEHSFTTVLVTNGKVCGWYDQDELRLA
jgi:hypothetical protein